MLGVSEINRKSQRYLSCIMLCPIKSRLGKNVLGRHQKSKLDAGLPAVCSSTTPVTFPRVLVSKKVKKNHVEKEMQ